MSKDFGELLVEGKNVVKDFPINSNALNQPMMRAINDVSFKMYKSRGLSVVGESGSGKSTTAKMIAKMYAPTEGVIEYKGRDIQSINDRKDLMHYREGVQMVWQDPFGSLNPTHNIFHHIARPLLIHKKVTSGNKKELEERVYDLLEQVGLIPPKETAQKFPHQLSGGQRQRVNLARNIAVGAEVVLADEPTSMLDVSIRAGVLNLMEEMKFEKQMSLLYITHDIATARYIAEDLAVMYVGHMVEWGDTEEIIHDPQHPYTQLLVSAVPDPKKSIHEKLKGNKGEIPLWTPESVGCPFSGRCTHASDKCREKLPAVTQLSDNHFVRCYLYE
ncbi:putative ABC-type dipeptide/oligopeptide/nickel transport system, ATPase component [Vibrio nigripulchritudo MADA3029]|uniref:ABC-type dipeptide/oligopeptide/nickel transport system, ATPase component n=2 Tax=Vibrio nigripulchritudo TaxID=28173 RepID=A0AAV2VQR1_9VIBR|nr:MULTISPECIES: ABC transporter ATP-binding protein [Vibrio]EGU59795.1 peptide ABC transporter ATP-binding protein [Vibrio nigripulchritudo ATCC 27043]KJY80067.1 chemotaxis protein [Vibrio nigripulchritudo]UAB69749.1 ABC transporter ATP-binding protein [Vibrio sp. SCSIO 43132]CCN45202.1 putative ABC-type dipeptide/oligopeptide/nickel transport system, ATPase component [Vibrio nigripulchritudo MADA3020]CCN53961.1 putative ABC-type dipeptide/oligopeptide/nickel transport system, ATPase componen